MHRSIALCNKVHEGRCTCPLCPPFPLDPLLWIMCGNNMGDWPGWRRSVPFMNKIFVSKVSPCIRGSIKQTQAEGGAAKGIYSLYHFLAKAEEEVCVPVLNSFKLYSNLLTQGVRFWVKTLLQIHFVAHQSSANQLKKPCVRGQKHNPHKSDRRGGSISMSGRGHLGNRPEWGGPFDISRLRAQVNTLKQDIRSSSTGHFKERSACIRLPMYECY